jgi:ATP-dependent DNA helicase RecG
MIDEAERFIKRNTRIAAKVTGFERREITEYPRIREEMHKHGLPEPVFEEIGQTFKVTFYGPGENTLDLISEEGVTDLRELGLNERQIEALRLMVNEGWELTNRQYREMFDITDRTALRDLDGLVEIGQIQRIGKGRGVRYVAI